MNSQRAAEIAESPDMAHVTYGEISVYIQHVDLVNGSARIYPLENPQDEQEVPINMLKEHAVNGGPGNAHVVCPRTD